MDPQRRDELNHKVEFLNNGIKASLICLLTTLTIMIIFVIVQLFAIQTQIADSIEANQRAGSSNHKRTQQYVKCIANILMKPLAERSPASFDSCGLEGTGKSASNPDGQPSVTDRDVALAPTPEAQQNDDGPLPPPAGVTAPVVQPPEQPTVTPPTTSAPPPVPERRSIPIVTPLINTVGNIVTELGTGLVKIAGGR